MNIDKQCNLLPKGTRGRRATVSRGNKSDREGQTLLGITYMWILKIEKKIKQNDGYQGFRSMGN